MGKKITSVLLILVLSINILPFPVYAGETDGWLKDWDYEVKVLPGSGTYVFLERYVGGSGNVTVYGRASVDGTRYPVCIASRYDDSMGRYVTGLNNSAGIVNLAFEEEDGVKVRPEIPDRLDQFFYGMADLETVSFGGNFQCVPTRATEMFMGCTSLKSVDLSGIDFSRTASFENMFRGCGSLGSIDMSYFDFSSASKLDGMFRECSSLESIDLSASRWPDWNSHQTTSAGYMFYMCPKLGEITLSDCFRPVDCESMVYVDTLTLLKVKGSSSVEFNENAMPGFKKSNRYIGILRLMADIELAGQELRDRMFSLAVYDKFPDRRIYKEEFNYAAKGNHIDIDLPVYAPGRMDIFFGERYVTNPESDNPVTIPVMDSGNYICTDEYDVSWSLLITRHSDGSLSRP